MAPDLKEIQPPPAPVVGTTTRQQVEALYRDFRVDSGVPELYWARMSRSDSKEFCPGCSQRKWQTVNMVATFDSNQVVQWVRIFSDVTLPAAVASMVQQGQMPSLKFSSPVTINAVRYPWTSDERYLRDDQMPVTVVLEPLTLTVSATRPGRWVPPRSARLVTVVAPRANAGTISVEYLGFERPHSGKVYRIDLWFKSKNDLAPSIHFETTFAEALILARWMAPPPTAQ